MTDRRRLSWGEDGSMVDKGTAGSGRKCVRERKRVSGGGMVGL